MKKLMIYIIAAAMLLVGCNKTQNVSDVQRPVPVGVITLNVEKTDTSLSYMGVINSESLKKYSFKTSGKLKTANVTQGQPVNAGDILLELDKSDLKLQVDAAKNQADAVYSQYKKSLSGAQAEDVKAAELNVEKAQAGYDFALNTYNSIKKLYEEGAVSETKFKETELNHNIASKELEQSMEMLKKAQGGARKEDISSAKSQYELAKTNYDAMLKLYNEASIISDVSGYVTDVMYEIGEMVPQGYPAVLVQSKNQMLTIGVTQDDVEKISSGMKAAIKINGKQYTGSVTNINQTPDQASRTFSVEVAVDEEDRKFYIGTIGEVEIITGNSEDIWIEIPHIQNDGDDYVYVVKNNTAVRKNITVKEIKNNKASVYGLSDGDILITSGQKNVKSGYVVEIVENK